MNNEKFRPESLEENSKIMESGKDNKIEERGAPENQELRALLEREAKALESFFGKKIDVPPLPAEITPEKYAEFKEKGFEMHYLPVEKIDEETEVPGWKTLPHGWFFEEIKRGNLPYDVLTLPGAWIAIDKRNKPEYERGNQVYENDVFSPALEKLRKDGFISDYKLKGSRFNITYNELHKPEVNDALAKALGVSAGELRLPRAVEWNYLGNAFYSQWNEPRGGDYPITECFEDLYKNNEGHLSGGETDLSYIHWDGVNDRGDDLGFRPIIIFHGGSE